MYCSNCGKKIDVDSKFCHFCGAKVDIDNAEPEAETPSREEKTSTKRTKSDLLWDKFAEVYDAKDGEREKFNSMSSEHIWELIERLSTNAFETFIEEKKEELNAQPYKVIEALKNHYLFAVVGGYRFWIAEELLKEEKLNKFKSFSLDDFIEEWKNTDFQKMMKNVSDEMGTCMTMYLEHRMNSLMENYPSIMDVSNATMKDLKDSITFQILNGYLAGVVEAKFRK